MSSEEESCEIDQSSFARMSSVEPSCEIERGARTPSGTDVDSREISGMRMARVVAAPGMTFQEILGQAKGAAFSLAEISFGGRACGRGQHYRALGSGGLEALLWGAMPCVSGSFRVLGHRVPGLFFF